MHKKKGSTHDIGQIEGFSVYNLRVDVIDALFEKRGVIHPAIKADGSSGTMDYFCDVHNGLSDRRDERGHFLLDCKCS